MFNSKLTQELGNYQEYKYRGFRVQIAEIQSGRAFVGIFRPDSNISRPISSRVTNLGEAELEIDRLITKDNSKLHANKFQSILSSSWAVN